jgi:hypothetical protein
LPTPLRFDFFRNNMGIVLEALLIDFKSLPQIGFLRSANPEKTNTSMASSEKMTYIYGSISKK